MPTPWFRFYSEALRDRKIERVCRETGYPKAIVIGVWTMVLALANDSPERGALLLTKDIALTANDLVMETGLDERIVLMILAHFDKLQMLRQGDDGVFRLVNWDSRQFISDSSTDRVRKHREQKEAEEDETAEPSEDETLQERSSNAPDTETETEPKTETETKAKIAPAKAGERPPKRRKPRTKQKKPAHVAVRVFRENAHRYPAKAWYENVAEVVGDRPADLTRWGQVIKAWVGLGWNPTNVKGMLEFFTRGEIPTGQGKVAKEPYAGIKEWVAEQEAVQ